jgi:hypothetical protein
MCSLTICHYLVVTLCMLGPLTCVADGGNASERTDTSEVERWRFTASRDGDDISWQLLGEVASLERPRRQNRIVLGPSKKRVRCRTGE